MKNIRKKRPLKRPLQRPLKQPINTHATTCNKHEFEANKLQQQLRPSNTTLMNPSGLIIIDPKNMQLALGKNTAEPHAKETQQVTQQASSLLSSLGTLISTIQPFYFGIICPLPLSASSEIFSTPYPSDHQIRYMFLSSIYIDDYYNKMKGNYPLSFKIKQTYCVIFIFYTTTDLLWFKRGPACTYSGLMLFFKTRPRNLGEGGVGVVAPLAPSCLEETGN